jgi:Flp pilus assembly protein TadD
VIVLLGAACVQFRVAAVEPLRVSQVDDRGDPRRRASLRLVIAGLQADGARAAASFERAIQLDATNPYAYLALARHHAEGSSPAHGAQFLDQAYALLEAEGALSPGVEPHLIGLRGVIQRRSGQHVEADRKLARARALAPGVWGDGSLSAAELR